MPTEIGAVDQSTLELAKELMRVSGYEEEISGDGDDAGEVEIGATRPVRRPARGGNLGAMTQMLAQALQGRNAPVARSTESRPKNAYTRVLPFVRDANHNGLIQPGTTVEITAQANQVFKPEALLFGDESSQDFLVEDIKLGPESIWAGEGPIPATEFTGESLLTKMILKTEQLSQKVTIKVTSRAQDPRPCYAYFVGLGAS